MELRNAQYFYVFVYHLYYSYIYSSLEFSQAKCISEDNELKNWVAELISDDGGNVGWLKNNWEAEKNKYGLLVKVWWWSSDLISSS